MRGNRYPDLLANTRTERATASYVTLGEVILSNPRGLEPWRNENWANGRDWRDRRGWKLGKLERLGLLEDLYPENWEYGSPGHLSAGDLERQPAEGGRRVFLAAFPRSRAGSQQCASCCLPPKALLGGHASQDWAPSPVAERTRVSLVG